MYIEATCGVPTRMLQPQFLCCDSVARDCESHSGDSNEGRSPEGEGCISHMVCECHAVCITYPKGDVRVHC